MRGLRYVFLVLARGRGVPDVRRADAVRVVEPRAKEVDSGRETATFVFPVLCMNEEQQN